LEKNGFIDTFWYQNKGQEYGYTWPASSLYKKEPGQRIDMIYTKNLKVINSVVSNSLNWISDHKMVVTDVEI